MGASEAITPTGAIASSCEALRRLLATCPGWQAWCVAETEDEARTRIGIGGAKRPADRAAGYTPDELKAMFPLAIIRLDEDLGRVSAEAYGIRRVAVGTFADFGRIELTIVDAVRDEDADDDERVYVNFLNRLGDVDAWFRAKADTNDYLAINRWYVKRSPGRTNEVAGLLQGDYMAVTWIVEWGMNEGIGGY